MSSGHDSHNYREESQNTRFLLRFAENADGENSETTQRTDRPRGLRSSRSKLPARRADIAPNGLFFAVARGENRVGDVFGIRCGDADEGVVELPSGHVSHVVFASEERLDFELRVV